METAEEQAAYGGHCVHGTAIGTPGGYDLLCGYCEAGEMTWTDDGPTAWWLQVFAINEDGSLSEVGYMGNPSYRQPFDWVGLDTLNGSKDMAPGLILQGTEREGCWYAECTVCKDTSGVEGDGGCWECGS